MLYTMAMRAWVIPAIVLVAVVMGISAIVIAMQEAEAQSTITNIGLAGFGSIEGNLLFLFVSEFSEGVGGTDLNGDGDKSDLVLHLFDFSTGTITNVGVSPINLRIDGNLAAFVVFEPRVGPPPGTDLNGDSDKVDNVLHVFDASAPLTMLNPLNVGLATTPLVMDGNLVAFMVSESAQGAMDLNGDTDATDVVLHVFDISTSTPTNVGLAALNNFDIDGNLVAFSVIESRQGVVGTDLNGDGDKLDTVLHVFDASKLLTMLNPFNVGLDTITAFVDGNFVNFYVSESDQDKDLNGDGDKVDNVLHVFDSSTSTTTNVGLATVLTNIEVNQIDGNLVAFRVSESDQGGTDLNGDGDATDAVLHVFDISTGVTTNVGLATGQPRVDGNFVTFRVSESGEGPTGTDLNGDGDKVDGVLHVFDSSKSKTTNVGLAIFGHLPEGNLVAFDVSESDQGGTDLNGDGDATDAVLHVFDISTGVTTNVGLAVIGFEIDGNLVAFTVPEFGEGATDLNGDGDVIMPNRLTDFVLHVFDTSTGVTTNVGFAIGNFEIDGNLVAFTVIESKQGATDLNGDNDAIDTVQHVLELLPLEGGATVGPGSTIGSSTIIDEGATVGSDSTIGADTTIAEGATVGDGSTIGDNTTIGEGTTVGDGSTIGDNTTIGEGATVGDDTTIGDNTTIGEGTTVGSDSTIGDNTTIGDNVVVKPGAVIGSGVTIGNNVLIGKNVVILDGAVVPNDTIIPKNTTFP